MLNSGRAKETRNMLVVDQNDKNNKDKSLNKS